MSTEYGQVLMGTLVTEKSERLRAEQSSYTFRVARGASKVEIRRAVEGLFHVHVSAVRVMEYPGKVRRMGMFAGPRPGWKKAVVRLKKGETIAALER